MLLFERFLPVIPPRTTAQQHKVAVRGGKPFIYKPTLVLEAESILRSALAAHCPTEPFCGALRLIVKWCFLISSPHKDGEYKITRPDTDNLEKLLKDVMTDLGFWKDDAQVASEIVEKFWAKTPGIFIRIEKL